MAIDSNRPVLWGADGKPLSLEGALLAPNALNVASVIQNVGKVYPHTWDEAMRDAPQNALAMRRDSFYRSLLQERTASTLNLEWEVGVPNEDDPVQKLQRDTLSRAWDELPDKPNLLYTLLDGALWWGRSGQQGMWGTSDSGLVNWLYHEPVHGDSIQYQWDRTPVVLVSWQQKQRLERDDPNSVINSSTRGAYGLRLYKPEYRKRFILHTHVREASDYYEGEMSGGVHGVGLRSWVYLSDYIRRDTLAGMLGFMNSVGMMDILVFNYPEGNFDAEKRAIENAKKVTGKFAIICPRPPNDPSWKAVEQLSMNTAGIDAVQNLLENYFDRYIRELFVGQNMSNGGGGPGGLEGDGRAELAGDTKFQLCKTDARRLAETLTRDWLVPCRDYNFPGSKVPVTMKPVLADPKAKEKAQNITVCVANGIEIEEDEARRALGFSKPREGKKTIGAKPPVDPTNPNQPPGDGSGGPVARPPQPPKPEGGHDLATDFLHRLGRLEEVLMYRLTQPPWPGAVFDEQRHRWVNKDGSDGPPAGSGRATTPGQPKQQPAPHLGEADRSDIINGIDADLKAWKGEEIPAGIVQRAKDVALTIAAKTYIWATQATHSKAMATIGEVMGAVFDTPADMMKLGYNPTTSSGTAGAGVADSVKANMADTFGVGISGHLVASIASKVLVKAAYWVRNRTGNDEQPTALSLVALLYEDDSKPDGFFEWAEFVQTVLARAAKGLGSDAQMPDAATVERNLRRLVEERQKKEGDRSATGYAWDESQVNRGQPGNAGQFAKKDGGSGGGSDRPKDDAGGRATTGNLRDRLGDANDPINSDAGRSGRATTHADKAAKRSPPKSVGAAGVVDVARSRRIKKAHKVEREVADAVDGANLPDSEPADVVYMPDARGKPITDPAESKRWLAQRAKVLAAHNKRQAGKELTAAETSLADAADEVLSNPAHFFEVKTLQKARQNRVRMTAHALEKKRAWQAKYNVVFSVVIVDERKGGKNSGHRVYVAPATLAKTVTLADCEKVGSVAEVLKHARGES